jgi:rhodanese-related sulfurtransferase
VKISVAQLSRMLRKGNVTGPALIDLRSPAAYRRSHPRGAVSIPASRIGRSLFLLPPRPRMLVLIGADPAQASACAAHLNEKGWTRVSWLDGAAADLDPALSASGREANRIWEPNPLLKRFEARLPRDGLACDLACG